MAFASQREVFPASNRIGSPPSNPGVAVCEATIRDPELHTGGVEPPARSLLVKQLAGNQALIGRPFCPDDEGQVTVSTLYTNSPPYFPVYLWFEGAQLSRWRTLRSPQGRPLGAPGIAPPSRWARLQFDTVAAFPKAMGGSCVNRRLWRRLQASGLCVFRRKHWLFASQIDLTPSPPTPNEGDRGPQRHRHELRQTTATERGFDAEL